MIPMARLRPSSTDTVYHVRLLFAARYSGQYCTVSDSKLAYNYPMMRKPRNSGRSLVKLHGNLGPYSISGVGPK